MNNKLWSIVTDIEISEIELESVYKLIVHLAGGLMESAEDVGSSASKALCFSEKAYNFADMILTALTVMKADLDKLAKQTETAFDYAKGAE